MSIFLRDVKVIGSADLFRPDLYRWLASSFCSRKRDPMTTFGNLLKSNGRITGILTPVTIGGFSGSSETKDFGCNCFTADGKCLTFNFLFGSEEKVNQLVVIEDNVYTVYDLICGNTLRKSSETIKRNGMELTGKMTKRGYMRTVDIHGEYIITVNLYEYGEGEGRDVRDAFNPHCIAAKDSIDDYLLNLRFPCTAEDIHSKISQINSSCVITYREVKVQKVIAYGDRNEIKPLSVYSTKEGRVYEYAHTDGNKTYGRSRIGDWFYREECNEGKYLCLCSYSSKTRNIITTVTLGEGCSCSHNVDQLISEAKEKIDTIREKVTL